MESMIPKLGVSDFVALTNQTLEYAYPSVEVEGEVSSFKVNQGKYVFFDLKDSEATINCFMTVFQLRVALEDGMKVIVTAAPKLTQWGKFSLTVRMVRPSGEGALKKSFELLKKKLADEGLFDEDRKRPLPHMPVHIGVISSMQAAGYGDFMKILDERWGGVTVDVAHVQVQGERAADQIIQAFDYFNARADLPELIILIRGGGSADDLAVFNDERLVRVIAASRIPVLTGIGHEVDESLADRAADVRAATPSNAAQLVVPDRQAVRREARVLVAGLLPRIERDVARLSSEVHAGLEEALSHIEDRTGFFERQLASSQQQLTAYDPRRVLDRGYALVRGRQVVGEIIQIETKQTIMKAEVTYVEQKTND